MVGCGGVPVTPAMQGSTKRTMEVLVSPGHKARPYLKNNQQKKSNGVARVGEHLQGSEFNPQVPKLKS
jgi:hypothetical protein